jgi:hypothetical protein
MSAGQEKKPLKLRFLIPLLLSCFAPTAFAADFSGVWKAELKAPNGTVIPFALDLKADGNTLNGTLQYATRKPKPLENGVIKSDEATFSIIEMSEAGPYKMSYKAKMEGDQLHLVGERENREGKMVKARDLMFTRK